MRRFNDFNMRLFMTAPLLAALFTGRALREHGRWCRDTDGFPAWAPGEFHAGDKRGQQYLTHHRCTSCLRESGWLCAL